MHKQHLARNYPQRQGDGNKQALIFTTVGKKGSSVSQLTSAWTAEATCEQPPPPPLHNDVSVRFESDKKKRRRSVIMRRLGLWEGGWGWGGINKARQRRF